MSLFLAAYDITHNRRRELVARVLSRYGIRVQKSVFEINAESDDLQVIRREVGPLLDRHDDFDIYPIDTRDPARRWRWQRSPTRIDSVVLL